MIIQQETSSTTSARDRGASRSTPSLSPADSVAATLSLLAPEHVVDAAKIRVGNAHGDGGYILLDLIRAGQRAFSFGLSNDVSFDRDLAERGVDVFMFDHTITGLSNEHPRFHFHREGVADVSAPEKSLRSLAEHVARHAPEGNDLLLKMDVEGWEWPSLGAAPAGLFPRFEQLALELHGLNQLDKPAFREQVARCLQTLLRTHAIFHVHANNVFPPASCDGIPVIPLIEISLVRRDLVLLAPSRTLYPTSIDVPNLPDRADHVLALHPFAPFGLTEEEFRAEFTRATRQARAFLPRKPAPEKLPKIPGRNIALGCAASQSSLSPWSRHGQEAGLAVDGQKTGGYAFHTLDERDPWWEVDLGQVRTFDEIVVHNRIDTCPGRSRYLHVSISHDRLVWRPVYAHTGEPFGGLDGDPLRVPLPRTAARFVRLHLPGFGMLHLDEIEIYDHTATSTSHAR